MRHVNLGMRHADTGAVVRCLSTGGSVISAQPVQKFGNNPVDVRDTDHYTEEYVPSFVEKWDSLIDWDRRSESEGTFFIDLLRERGVKKVLDVATGTGFHSVRLLEAGFETVSADGSGEMLAQAFANGLKHGDHILRVVQADWRWLNRDAHGEYDAIVCLGNSFTHLFSERDRRKALAEFYAMLKHDGILVLDQRNYDAILDRGYSSKHVYYYCGEDVAVEPEYVDEGLVRMRYSFPDESVYHLNMFPLRKDYTRRLMQEVGFQRIETYGDFQHTYRTERPDFFIHVAEKEYIATDEPAGPAAPATGEGSTREPSAPPATTTTPRTPTPSTGMSGAARTSTSASTTGPTSRSPRPAGAPWPGWPESSTSPSRPSSSTSGRASAAPRAIWRRRTAAVSSRSTSARWRTSAIARSTPSGG